MTEPSVTQPQPPAARVQQSRTLWETWTDDQGRYNIRHLCGETVSEWQSAEPSMPSMTCDLCSQRLEGELDSSHSQSLTPIQQWIPYGLQEQK